MLAIIADQKEAVGLWLLDRLPDLVDIPGGYYAIGVANDHDLIGGVLFTNYRPCKGGGDIEISCAGHGWLSRRVIRTVFSHPFDVLGCHRITALVRKSNKPSRRLLEGIGFTLEGRIREGFGPRQHGMVYGMLRGEWVASKINRGGVISKSVHT